MGLKDRAGSNPSMSSIQSGVCSMCCGLVWAIVFGIFGFSANPWACWGQDYMKAAEAAGISFDFSSSSSSSSTSVSWSSSASSANFTWGDAWTSSVYLAASPDCYYQQNYDSWNKKYMDLSIEARGICYLVNAEGYKSFTES